MNLPVPTIEDIIISEEDKQRLDKVLDPKSKYSKIIKQEAIRKISGGFCFLCEKLPTRILKYQLEGAMLIERYCKECYDKLNS
jgi:hypothetical protein